MIKIKLRASVHSGRTGKNGRYKVNHNDRNFDVSKSDHIDQERIKDNKEFRFVQTAKEYDNLEDYERHLYELYFADGQSAKNERYKSNRHPERCKDVNALYENNRTCPEEVIFQVGNINESIDGEKFEAIMKDFVARFNAMYKGNVMIIDYTTHLDETTPHSHCRQIYLGHDKDGNAIPNESKALKELGIEPPDVNQKIGRYNSPKMTFTAKERELFQQVVKEHEIEIETTPIYGRKAKDLATYKLDKINEDIKNGEAQITEQKSIITSIKNQIQKLMERAKILKVAEYIFKNEKQLYDAIEEEVIRKENLSYDRDHTGVNERRPSTLDFYQEIER